jgi:hypothetical protein
MWVDFTAIYDPAGRSRAEESHRETEARDFCSLTGLKSIHMRDDAGMARAEPNGRCRHISSVRPDTRLRP